MGSIVRRGTRAKPRYYARYRDLDGRQKMRALPGIATQNDAAKALAVIEANVVHGRLGIAPKTIAMQMRDAIEQWLPTRRTRNRMKDEQRVRKYLLPAFGSMTMAAAQETSAVLVWLDQLRATGNLEEPTLRSFLTLLSGFWTWAIERRLASVNPVRMLPKRDRPKRKESTADHPWLKTDAEVWAVLELLQEPFRTAFWLGNRSGIRPGELAGLRLSDMQWLAEGNIRVRFNYDGPLKEDKDTGKVKWVPAPDDWGTWLAPVIARRRAEGAGDEDVLFRYTPGVGRPRKKAWEGLNEDGFKDAWQPVREKLKLGKMRFYDGTRHSYVSRNLAAGVPIGQVSESIGHASTDTTRASYNHFIRKEWLPGLRAPLQERQQGSPVESVHPAQPGVGEGSPLGPTTDSKGSKTK